METTTAIKSGRAFNDRERDRGTVVHIVPKQPETTSGFWGYAALCGTKPGYRGNGWSEVQREATCKKCIERNKK